MEFKRLHTDSEVLDLIEYHNAHSDHVTLDVETSSKYPREAKLIDVQIGGYHEDSAVIFAADKASNLSKLSKSLILVAHNGKYDAHVLFRHGVDLLDYTWRDTILLGHLLDENRKSYSLDSYVQEMTGSEYKTDFWEKYESYEEAPEEDRIEYACRDVVYTERLYRTLIRDLHTGGVPKTLIEHVGRLQRSLLKTEIEGVKIDLDYLTTVGLKLSSRINEIAPQMRELVKDEIEILEMEAWAKELDKRKTDKGRAAVERPTFNFESSRQLQSLLYDGLALPAQKNEKTKAISTDFDSLEKLKDNHPVVALIQENRELQKVYGTYIEGTSKKAVNETIYPEFRVNGTVTGRISHANPNLGQLPRAGGIRGIYVPHEGHVFISADYSQLEVCIEANLTGDVALKRIFVEGLSKHDVTAEGLKIDRNLAKTLNFAMQYHCTHFKVAKILGVSEKEGLNVWNEFWNVYSGPKALKERTDRAVDDGVPLTNAFGRQRRFSVRGRSRFDGDYRQAYNFLIQGTGADLTSRAFYLTSEYLRENGTGRGLFTVHDELLIEVKKGYEEEAQEKMTSIMTQVGNDIGLKIPLKAEASGPMDRWLD